MLAEKTCKANVTAELISQRLGSVVLEPPGAVIAGMVGQWRLKYTVGSYGIDEGGTIKLSQRFASDWQVPQFEQPDKPGYTTISTTGVAKLHPYYSTKAHERPWMKCLVMDIYDGCLKPGDTVTITLGDRSNGSPGIRAQTFQESAHEFRVLVDPTNACVARRLPTSPMFPVVAADPADLVCVVPTQAVVGEPVKIHVRGVDQWGNPTPAPENLSLTWCGTGRICFIGTELMFKEPGSGHLMIEGSGLKGRSNPIICYEKRPLYHKAWGDLHAQSDTTVGTGTEEEYFRFARDQAYLDFASHQANDFQVTDDNWRCLNRAILDFQKDGSFVILPGYEWSGNSAAGGDRNVFFRKEGFPILRSSHWQIPDTLEGPFSPAHPASVLFERMHELVGSENVIVAAHVGGRYADIGQYFDQELCHLVEVVSCWGVFEWLLWDAYESGYIVGIMCNSDGHKGRPGAEGPGAGEFGIANGLTCALVPELTRQQVFDALRARRCYGTTGPRMDLDFVADGHPMGAVIPWSESVHICGSVIGTAPMESLSLFCGREIIHQVRSASFSELTDSHRVRVSWGGARTRGRGRRVTWDGVLCLEGARILEAVPFAFDAVTDGVLHQDAQQVVFQSRTTGDRDGFDLWLDEIEGGILSLAFPIGSYRIDLGQLREKSCRQIMDLGGENMHVCIELYPEYLEDLVLSLDTCVFPPTRQRTPYLLKAVQSDGHLAWASPIYVEANEVS